MLLALALLPALASAPAAGQTVLGHTVASGTDVPLVGVFVTLTDEEGEQAAGFLSGAEGEFVIRAPAAGRYVLRAELIGYGTVERTIELEAEGTARETLRLPLEAARLEGIAARGTRKGQCALRPDEGNALSRLWAEARKGLRIANWTEEIGKLRANGYTYQRILELADLEILAESVLPAQSLERNAFVAADPERIRAEGFVLRTDDGGTLYRGADAALLLSDAFLQTHCFSLLEHGEDGLVGLAFEPVPDRDLPDIEGVLWIDAETGRLHTLDYRYTRYPLPFPLPDSRFGGHTSFRHLPGGGVAVERWWIRMPTLHDWADDPALRSARRCGTVACDDPETLRRLSSAGLAVEEEGGQVLSFRLADGTTLTAGDRATVTGVVLDSTVTGSPAPLAGAEVMIQGTGHRTVTDTRGAFRLDDLPEGTYRLGFDHPRLAELGIARLEAVRAHATPDEIASITLATPSPGTLAAARCQARVAGDSSGSEAGADPGPRPGTATVPGAILHGVVRDAATGVPIGGARVSLLRDSGDAGGSRRARGATPTSRQETDPRGRYLFCDVAAGPARLTAEYLGKGHHELHVVPAANAPTRIDVDLVLSAVSRVLGRVVHADAGDGVGGASVRIRETGQHALTDGAGHFAFDSVPPGALTLESELIGFRPTKGVVAVRSGELVRIELRVAEEVFELPPLVVTARSRPLLMEERLGGFYVRQARGLGTFIDRETLDQRPTAQVTDLLKEVSSFRVAWTGSGRILSGSRNAPLWPRAGTQNPFCSPMVYLDGAKISTRLEEQTELYEMVRIIDSIPPSEIAGIEIYPGPATVPGEFAGLDTGCGVIAVWTRVRDLGPGAP